MEKQDFHTASLLKCSLHSGSNPQTAWSRCAPLLHVVVEHVRLRHYLAWHRLPRAGGLQHPHLLHRHPSSSAVLKYMKNL